MVILTSKILRVTIVISSLMCPLAVKASSPLIVLPTAFPEKLYPAEYLMLTKNYLQYGNYDLAEKCIKSIHKLAPGSDIDCQATELELEHFAKYIEPSKFLEQHPRSLVAHIRALKELQNKNASTAAIENLTNKTLTLFPQNIESREILAKQYRKQLQTSLPDRERKILEDKENKLLATMLEIEPFNMYATDQKQRRENTKTIFFNAKAWQEAIKNGDPIIVTGGFLPSPPLEKHSGFVDPKGKFVSRQIWSTGFELNPFEFEFCHEPLEQQAYAEGIFFDGDTFRDKNGNVAFKIFGLQNRKSEYRWSMQFSEGLCTCAEKGLWGYINRRGDVVISQKYTYAKSFSEGLAPVCDKNGWHYIDKNGKTVIAGPFQRAKPFREGLAAVYIKEKFGFIDRAGKLVIPAIYDDAGSFHEGIAQTIKLETPIMRWHIIYINKDGSKAFDLLDIQLKYDKFGSSVPNGTLGAHGTVQPNAITERVNCSNGFVLFKVNGKFGYVDKLGRTAIVPKFDNAESFREGLSAVQVGKKYGYIDKNSKFVIEPQFLKANNFSEGLAYVETQDKKHLYIDKAGKHLFQVTGHGDDFHDGVALIRDLYPSER